MIETVVTVQPKQEMAARTVLHIAKTAFFNYSVMYRKLRVQREGKNWRISALLGENFGADIMASVICSGFSLFDYQIGER